MSRRLDLLCFLLVGTATVGSFAQTNELAEQLKPLIDSHSGQISIAIKHLHSGETYLHEADRVMPTASLIKFPLMVSAYGKIHCGHLSRDELLPLNDSDKVPGSGILTDHFSPGTCLKIRDLIRLMIVFSDNTATNLVADRIGLVCVNAELERLGLKETRMNSLAYRRERSVDPERSQKFGLGSTTAREIIQLFELLERGKLHSAEICQEMKEQLLSCEDNTKLKRYLPKDVPVAHKSGEVSNARCDAGLIYGQSGAIAICVMTAENTDLRFDDDHPVHLLIGRIAQTAHSHFNPNPPSSIAVNTLQVGSTGSSVAALQRTLNAKLEPSPGLMVDGQFGPATEAAVIQFQTQTGLSANGVVDAAFWEQLGDYLQDPEVSAPEIINNAPWTRNQADELTGAPLVTADAWVVIDNQSGSIIGGHNYEARLQIASTTKIMTAWLVLKLATTSPEILNERVIFSKRAAATIGSSARLDEGESVTVDELMYGLLLPSGNDASVALAEHFGSRLTTAEDDEEIESDPLKRFVKAMNCEAAELGLANLKFANPHGMTDRNAYGSALDLAVLTRHVWQNERFRQYVGTPKYGCTVIGPSGYRRPIRWDNSNQLLKFEGFGGVKTGTTDAAGCCLVTHAQRDGEERVVVVLAAKSNESRYTDARNLIRWSWGKTSGLELAPSESNLLKR
jgi:D-alanyl-D-alanine carboxypeptidase (penicillin-binding protein 5/6)